VESSPVATLFFQTLFSLSFSGLRERLPTVVERSSAFFRKTLQKKAKKQMLLPVSFPLLKTVATVL